MQKNKNTQIEKDILDISTFRIEYMRYLGIAKTKKSEKNNPVLIIRVGETVNRTVVRLGIITKAANKIAPKFIEIVIIKFKHSLAACKGIVSGSHLNTPIVSPAEIITSNENINVSKKIITRYILLNTIPILNNLIKPFY